MAEKPIDDEEFEAPDLEIDLEADDVELDDELVEVLDEELVDEVDVIVEEEDEVDEAELPARPKREDEVDPDEVEADLDAILKDRIAAADDDEEDDEEVAPEPRSSAEIAEGVTPKKANEFTCTGCFLLVNRGQFGPDDAMHCPVGEADCPAITQLQSMERTTTPRASRSTKTAAKASSVTAKPATAKKAPAKRPAAKKKA